MDLKEVKDDILSPIEDPTNTLRGFSRRLKNFSRGIKAMTKRVFGKSPYEDAYREARDKYIENEVKEGIKSGNVDIDRIRKEAVFSGVGAGIGKTLAETPNNMRDAIKLSKGGLGTLQSINELAHMPDMYKHSSASGHESALGMTPMEGEVAVNKLIKAARVGMAAEDVGIKTMTDIVKTSKAAYSRFNAGPAREIADMFKSAAKIREAPQKQAELGKGAVEEER